jgi:hypothetical protein
MINPNKWLVLIFSEYFIFEGQVAVILNLFGKIFFHLTLDFII